MDLILLNYTFRKGYNSIFCVYFTTIKKLEKKKVTLKVQENGIWNIWNTKILPFSTEIYISLLNSLEAGN